MLSSQTYIFILKFQVHRVLSMFLQVYAVRWLADETHMVQNCLPSVPMDVNGISTPVRGKPNMKRLQDNLQFLIKVW